MHVVVTGAAGFIGSHLCEALVARGHRVTATDGYDGFLYPAEVKRRNAARMPVPVIEAELGDAGAMTALVAGADVVCHLAALAGVSPSLLDPARYVQTNLVGTTVLLEAMRASACRRLVFASSSSVYGAVHADDLTKVAAFREDDPCLTPASPYAATKRAGELVCSTYRDLFGFGISALRFFTVYGPRQRPDLAIHAFARKMVEGGTLTLFGDGTQARDYTYCDDIVAGVLAALRWTEQAPIGVEHFNLGGNRSVPTGAMVDEISAALGMTPKVEWAPMQPGDVQRTAADLTKSGAVLGYAPRTPFPEGIGRFVAWFREAYGRSD